MLILAALPLMGLSGCPVPTVSPVVIHYRETFQFVSYLGAGPGGGAPLAPAPADLAFALYYQITCIENNGNQAADFTFEPARVHYIDRETGFRSNVVTHDIAALPPASGWKHPLLTASQTIVGKGQVVGPTQLFSFLIQDTETFASNNEARMRHTLSYDNIQGQPVLAIEDLGNPDPVFDVFATDDDFRAGVRIFPGAPNFPPPVCPSKTSSLRSAT